MNPFKLSTIFFILICSVQLKAQKEASTILKPEIREAIIQKALALRKQENFGGAIAQLDSILSYQPKDAGALLFKGDVLMQSKQFSKAVENLKKLIPLNYEVTITKINLSYALFMSHHPSKALVFAKEAWENDKNNKNAIVNYFNALLWNIKTKQASVFLEEQKLLLKPEQILVLKARLFTTSGNYKAGLKRYDSLTNAYPNKHYYQEYAEVLLGKKDISKSNEVMNDAKSYFSESEFKSYQNKLQAVNMQYIATEFVYFQDVAKNTRIENSIAWQQSENRVYRFRLAAGNADIKSAIGEKTTAQFAHLTVNERWNKTWSGQSDLHFQLINPQGSEKFNGLTGKQTIQYQPNDRRMIGISLSSDILNFTASLFGKNIRSNSIGYVTHLMLDGKTGFYSQGSAGFLSDHNQNLQFFGSLYRLFRTEPTLKGGVNFSALHFKDNNITSYFSPNKYLSSEVFAEYSTALPQLSKFFLNLQTAAGIQKIENNNWESALRFQTELDYRLNHFETSLKYQTSNVASATGTGYSFNWYTLKLVYKW
jgi:tetratricopeptide (TPR) repeat protein